MRHALLTVFLLGTTSGLFAQSTTQPIQEKPMISRFTVELPNLQCPISLIIDDPFPVIADRLSAADLEKRKAEGKGVDWWTFFDDLTALFAEYGMKGKFSMLSYREGVGMIDKITDPKRKKQLDEFVSALNKRVAPNFDITPEMISHGAVLNVETDQPLGVKDNECVWSQTQSEETLERYIGRALLALKNVGIAANGVTSPWDFGSKNEANYARAIWRSLKRVYGVKLSWYFCQSDSADYMEPRLMYLDRQNKEAVVNIMPTSRTSDLALSKQLGRDIPKIVDVHITPDGKEGVFPTMVASRSYIVFYKHWGNLYDQGQETGLKVLREALARMRQYYPDDVQWMACSEVARYYAAAKTYRLTQKCGGTALSVYIETPFPCPNFTVSFTVPRELKRITVREKNPPTPDTKSNELKRVDQKAKRLESHTWCQERNTIYACFDLKEETEMVLLF